jgi:hypothetical protein
MHYEFSINPKTGRGICLSLHGDTDRAVNMPETHVLSPTTIYYHCGKAAISEAKKRKQERNIDIPDTLPFTEYQVINVANYETLVRWNLFKSPGEKTGQFKKGEDGYYALLGALVGSAVLFYL